MPKRRRVKQKRERSQGIRKKAKIYQPLPKKEQTQNVMACLTLYLIPDLSRLVMGYMGLGQIAGECVHSFRAPLELYNADLGVACLADGKLVFFDGCHFVLTDRNGEILSNLHPGNALVAACGHHIFYTHEDGDEVTRFNVMNEQVDRSYALVDDDIVESIQADAKRVVVMHGSGRVQIFNLEQSYSAQLEPCHGVFGMALSDPFLFVLGDNTFLRFDMEKNCAISKRVALPPKAIHGVTCFLVIGEELLIAKAESTLISTYSIETGALIKEFACLLGVRHMAYNEEELFVCCVDEEEERATVYIYQ